MKIRNNIYVYAFLGNIFLDRTVWLTYLQSNSYTLLSIGVLQSILTFAMFAFELPSGIIADYFSPKITIILGHTFIILYLISMLFCQYFSVLMFGFFCYGIGLAMISGSDQTVVHSIDSHKQYISKIGIFNAICILSIAFSSFFGGILSNFSWRIIFISEILVQLVCIIYISSLKITTSVNNSSPSLNTMKKHFYISIKNKKILKLVFLLAIFEGTFSCIFNFSQALFNHLEFSPFLTSLTLSFAFLFSSVAGFSINKVVRHLGKEKLIIVFVIISILIHSLYLLEYTLLSVLLYFTSKYTFEIIDTSLNASIHEAVNDQIRTSIISFANTLTALVMFLESILFGYLFSSFNFLAVYSMIGIIVSAIILLLTVFMPRQRAQ
ncbi:MAG: MFS transporter [Candidatus Ancillula sp.]|jgi:MFS family permease|nr:MFS transporter [Candidatus Ancillula sp.]